MKRMKILSRWRGQTLNTKIYFHHALNRRTSGLRKGHLLIGLSFSLSHSRYISLSSSTRAGWKVEDLTDLSYFKELKSLRVPSNQEARRSQLPVVVLQSTTIRFSPNKNGTNENSVFFDTNRLETFLRMFLKKYPSLRIERE